MHTINAKAILSTQNGMNVYRGCLHGCIYCDTRSDCYQLKHDFEDIEVKINAPKLLEEALKKKRQKCMISTGSMCDPYIPLEKELCITRKCLELVEQYGFGADVLTKSDLVLRDLDILKKINEKTKAVVQLTITTHDEALCKILEPNVCTTKRRVEVLEIMKEEGISTIVWLCPLLPFLNDTKDNVNQILDDCIRCGVKGILTFGMGLSLRSGDRQYFYKKLDEHFPGLKEKYIETYGNAYHIPSPNQKKLSALFHKRCAEYKIMTGEQEVFSYLRKFEEKKKPEQLTIFDFLNKKTR